MDNINSTDIKILNLLQENARLTIKDIAKKINLSITPVHERIKKLETEGIIEKYVAVLNRKKIGKSLLVYCQVTLNRQIQENFITFNESISNIPEVIECNVVSGTFDYLLKIVVKDMEAYQQLYTTKLSGLKSVEHISSFFVMSEVKNTTKIAI